MTPDQRAGRSGWARSVLFVLVLGLLAVRAAAHAEPSFDRSPPTVAMETTPDPSPTPAAPQPSDQPDPDPESAGPELRADDQPRSPEGAGDVEPGKTLDFYWKDGVNYQLRPLHVAPEPIAQYERWLAIEGRVGIKLAVDAAGFDSTGSLPTLDPTAELRRFFLYTVGKFHLVYPIVFKLEVGVVDDEPYVDNFYFGARDVPWLGTVEVGQIDAPMSLDLLTGSTNRPFMEAPAPVQALAPGQKAGVQIASFSDRYHLSWQGGLFTDGQRQDVGDATRDVLRGVGRIVWRRVEGPPVSTLVHVALSASYVLSSADRVRYRSRPESYLAPYLIDTGELDAESVLITGAELALRDGPTTVQSEVLASFVRSSTVGDPVLYGGYLELSHFLTGEARPYERALGIFGHVDPKRDFDPRQGTWGAFEVATRFSATDLNDAGARGGRMWLFGAGLNWYWSRYVRLMFGYELAFVRGTDETGNLQVFQGRVQLVL